MSRRSVIISLAILSILALGLRLGTIIHLKAWKSPNAMEHRSVAMGLVQGHGFAFGDWGYYGPSSVQSPPYPFVLATMFKIFGTETPADGSLHGANRAYLAAMVLNSLAGAGLVWLVYSMTTTLGGSALAGVLAAAAVAVWPSQVYAARHAQAIALITCTLVASITLFYKGVRSGKLTPWTGYCFIGALAALTEPVFLPSLALSGLLILLWCGLDWKIRLRNAGMLIFATAVVIGPWSVRNRIVHGKWVPIKSTFWVNVWKGNNDFATGTDRLALTDDRKAIAKASGDSLQDDALLDSKLDGERQYDMLDPSQKARLYHQPEAVREEVFKEFATSWIKTHHARYLKLCGIRLMKTLTVDWDNPKSYNSIYIASRYAMLLITLLGMYAAWRQGWSMVLPGVIAGTALLTYTLTVTAARFSIPFEPLQLAMGAGFVAQTFVRSKAGIPAVSKDLAGV